MPDDKSGTSDGASNAVPPMSQRTPASLITRSNPIIFYKGRAQTGESGFREGPNFSTWKEYRRFILFYAGNH